MTALSTNARRDTKKHGGDMPPFFIEGPVSDAVQIKAGSLVVLNGGTLEPASTATGLVAVGRASKQVDNLDSLSPAPTARIETGIFSWENSADADELTASDIGKVVYIVDDQTVAKTSATSSRSPAGVLVGFDDDGLPMVHTNPTLNPSL